MSKNDMVAFPRELSDELAELIADRARVCGGGAFEIWEAIVEGFGTPYDDHKDIAIHALNGLIESRQQIAEHPQVDPVAWRCDARNGGTGRYSRTVDTEEEMRSFVAHYEGIGAIIQVTPLYTHADPGEVERLRAEVERLRSGFFQQVTDADLKQISDFVGDGDLPTKSFFLRPDAANLANVTMHMVREVQAARAQLAERDALLYRMAYYLSPALTSHQQWMSKETMHDALSALHEWRKLQGCSASAAPSAPVEIDERAEFEAWGADQGYFNLKREHSGKYKFQTAWAAWEGWQARAALESKS